MQQFDLEALRRIVFDGFQKLGLLYRNDAFGYDVFSSAEDKDLCRRLLADGTLGRVLALPDFSEFQTAAAVNIRKLVLAARNFDRHWSQRAIAASVAFSLSGCILDSMLDGGTEELKRLALSLLDWECGCGSFFTADSAVFFGRSASGIEVGNRNKTVSGAASESFNAIETLLAETGSFLQEIRASDVGAYQSLIADLQHLAQVECRASVAMNVPSEFGCACDKSTKFVLTSFRIAASGQLEPEEDRQCQIIGEVMRLVDDLCDLECDLRMKHLNSIICQAGDSNSLVDHVQDAFLLLDENLSCLKLVLKTEFFDYLLRELRLWTLGNEQIRSKVLRRDVGKYNADGWLQS